MNNNNPTGKAQNSSDKNYHPPFFWLTKLHLESVPFYLVNETTCPKCSETDVFF
jgi:hypothetical protein